MPFAYMLSASGPKPRLSSSMLGASQLIEDGECIPGELEKFKKGSFNSFTGLCQCTLFLDPDWLHDGMVDSLIEILRETLKLG